MFGFKRRAMEQKIRDLDYENRRLQSIVNEQGDKLESFMRAVGEILGKRFEYRINVYKVTDEKK